MKILKMRISDEDLILLQYLAMKSECTMSDVMRRGLDLYDFFIDKHGDKDVLLDYDHYTKQVDFPYKRGKK